MFDTNCEIVLPFAAVDNHLNPIKPCSGKMWGLGTSHKFQILQYGIQSLPPYQRTSCCANCGVPVRSNVLNISKSASVAVIEEFMFGLYCQSYCDIVYTGWAKKVSQIIFAITLSTASQFP